MKIKSIKVLIMNKVLLIDALHINDSGGKILLDFFIDSIENSKIEAFYLLDKRIKNDPLYRSKKNILFLKANPLVRFFFYLKNKERFSKVFCFGNIPPPVKMRVESFTYFHNKLLLVIPTGFNFKTKFKLFLKFKFIKYLSKNTDYWVVQSKLMKNEFLRKMNLEPDNKVLIHPFFPSFKGLIKKNIPRIPFSFLYVSKYHKHKNFENLIRGFKIFYDEFNIGELHLTLVNDNSSIINSINELVLKGYPVINHGFVTRDKLAYLYRSSEFIVYPSFWKVLV